MWPFNKKQQPAAPAPKKKQAALNWPRRDPSDYPAVDIVTPTVAGTASDSAMGKLLLGSQQGVPDAIGDWFAAQGAVPARQAAWMAKHWLIDKAVSMPARDAVRQGWELDSENQELIDTLQKHDKKSGIEVTLQDFVSSARRTGGAIALFHTCPAGEDESEYYEAPFNLDAVTEYNGISIIDSSEANGEVLGENVSNPASLRYMKPEFYRIGNKRYHHSHVIYCIPYPVADYLKATYGYFGQSVAERVYSRAYAAERTADEAPLLVMTKRLRTLGVDLESVINDGGLDTLVANVQGLQEMADNLGVFVYDTANGGGLTQIDTGLADLDANIMTQYQLVAAIAEVPATKLLGTSPKGFNATGESEAEDYRQSLESIQTVHMMPLLERHYSIECQLLGDAEGVTVTWMALDSPTAQEFAEIDSKNGATIAGLVSQMVLTPSQGAAILSQSKDSMFFGHIEQNDELESDADELLDGLMGDDDEVVATPTPTTAAPDVAEGDNLDPKASSLNGAQVTAMLEIISRVSMGDITKNTAIKIMQTAFPITEAEAVELMADAIEGSHDDQDQEIV